MEVDSSAVWDLFGSSLCHVLGLGHSFKGCALLPSFPFQSRRRFTGRTDGMLRNT